MDIIIWDFVCQHFFYNVFRIIEKCMCSSVFVPACLVVWGTSSHWLRSAWAVSCDSAAEICGIGCGWGLWWLAMRRQKRTPCWAHIMQRKLGKKTFAYTNTLGRRIETERSWRNCMLRRLTLWSLLHADFEINCYPAVEKPVLVEDRNLDLVLQEDQLSDVISFFWVDLFPTKWCIFNRWQTSGEGD